MPRSAAFIFSIGEKFRLKAKHAYFETVAARLEALELRKNQSIQITAEKGLGDQVVDVKYRVPTVELIHTNE